MSQIIHRPLLKGDWIGGRYRVESYIGSGSIGSVYIVTDSLNEDQKKAIKFIPHTSLSDEDIHTLSKRIRTLHRLNVKGVLTALEQGADENGIYFTMEYLPYPTIGSIADTLSDFEITLILYELSGILAELHEYKFLHRRLHPNNIFVHLTKLHTILENQFITTVSDAGLSLPHLPTHYQSFLAPELLEGSLHDIQTELYAFGVLGYALYHRALSKIIQEPNLFSQGFTTAIYSWTNQQISKDISSILLRCLNQDPKLRPFDFREVETVFYRNLRSKPAPKSFPLSSVFVGRGNEFRYFSIRSQEVQHDKQWAILIQGERESGKSRLIDEFAIDHQLRGKVAIRLDQDHITPLLKLFPYSRALTLESAELFEYVSENLEKLFKEKSLPTPLVICWHNFDRLSESAYLFFKQILILKPELPILWLLEARDPIPSLEAIGYSEHLNRYQLPPLQQKDLEKFIGSYLHYTSGYQSLTRQLIQYFGSRPGWLINALQILFEKKAITYDSGQFRIHPLEIEKLIKSGQLSPSVDLTILSPLAKTIIQWMSVYEHPLTMENLRSIFGVDELDLSNSLFQLTSKGFLIQSGIYYQFRLPVLKDVVRRSIQESRIKFIHGWIAQWQERNFSAQPTAQELWTVAKNYYEAGERHAFLRVYETLLEKYGNQLDFTFPEAILISALEEKKSPLSNVNQFRTLRLLYRQYFREGKYDKSLEICNIIQQNNEFRPFYFEHWLANRFGSCYLAKSDYQTAKTYFEKALLLWNGKNQREYITSLRALIHCLHYLDLSEIGYKTLLTYRMAIETISNPSVKFHEYNTYAILLLQYNCFADARRFLEEKIETFPEKMSDDKINSIIQIMKIYLKSGDHHSFEHIYTKYQGLFRKSANPYQNLVRRHYYVVMMIQKGLLRKVHKEIQEIIQLSKIYYLPINQCHALFDWADVYYYSGQFENALSCLKQALQIINRTNLQQLKPIALIKINNILSVTSKRNPKFERHIQSLINNLNNNKIFLIYAYDICSFISDQEIHNFIISSYKIFSKNELYREEYYSFQLIKLLIYRLSLRQNINDDFKNKEKEFKEFEENLVTIVEPFDRALYLRELFLCSILLRNGKETFYFRNAIGLIEKLNAHWLKADCYLHYGTYLKSTNKLTESQIILQEAQYQCQQLGIPFQSSFVHSKDIGREEEENEMPILVQTFNSLNRFIFQFNQIDDGNQLYQTLLKELVSCLNATTGYIFLVSEKSSQLGKRPRFTEGQDISEEQQIYILAKESFSTKEIVRLGQNGISKEPISPLKAISIPLRQNNHPYAVVTLFFEKEVINPEWIESYIYFFLQFIHTIPFYEKVSSSSSNLLIPVETNTQLHSYYGIVGKSPAMQEVYGMLELLKGKDYPVLIIGESGTGKELVSQIIYKHSPRANGPYYVLNCATIQETLIESELFGHIKGAFTGADQSKDGFFTLANNGTIFLDEINQISLSMQGKMLRVLQEGEFYPVGSTKVKKTDVRIICAGKPELLTLLKEGKFREDFYYRINVIEIRLPPLRQRKDDIPLLVNHFIELYNQSNEIQVKGIRKQALDILTAYDFPGNVRELKNTITFATLQLKKSGYIEIDHLPKEIVLNYQNTVTSKTLQDYLGEFEKKLILQVLNRTNWNRSLTSKILGISRPTLNQKIKLYHLKNA